MKRASNVLLFALAAGLSAGFAFILAFHGVHEVSRRAPTAPFLALLLLLFVPLQGRLGRWALGPRGAVAARLGIALVAPLVALGALHELSDPLIHAHPPTCGTPRVMLEMSVPPAMFAAGAMGALAAAFPALHPRLDRALHGLTLAAAAVAAVLVVASLVRAASRPDTDGYVASLSPLAEITAAAVRPGTVVTRAAADRSVYEGSGSREHPVDVYDDEIDGVILRRACAAHQCYVGLVPRGTPAADAMFGDWEVAENATVELRRDPAREIWAVHGHGWRPYQGRSLQLRSVLVSDVAPSVRPPLGWILGGASGLLAGLAALALRRRVAARRSALAAGREGTLEPSGLLRLAGDDPPIRVAPGQALAVGPVVLLPGPVSPGGVYRGDGLLVGARVACGPRDELLAAVDLRMAHLDAFALAAIVLGAAPLVASALVGIVL